jgi:hypothetical protein
MTKAKVVDIKGETKFPLWRNPSWVEDSGALSPLNEVCEEYFDTNGKLIGVVMPFGTIWKASIYSYYDRGVASSNSLNVIIIGCYYTKDQAKKAVSGYK